MWWCFIPLPLPGPYLHHRCRRSKAIFRPRSGCKLPNMCWPQSFYHRANTHGFYSLYTYTAALTIIMSLSQRHQMLIASDCTCCFINFTSKNDFMPEHARCIFASKIADRRITEGSAAIKHSVPDHSCCIQIMQNDSDQPDDMTQTHSSLLTHCFCCQGDKRCVYMTHLVAIPEIAAKSTVRLVGDIHADKRATSEIVGSAATLSA